MKPRSGRGLMKLLAVTLATGALHGSAVLAADAPETTEGVYEPRPTWTATMLASRAAWQAVRWPDEDRVKKLTALDEAFQADFPVPWDWARQDSQGRVLEWFEAEGNTDWERRLLARALDELPERGGSLRVEFDALCQGSVAPEDPRWLSLYTQACEQRRVQRLKTVLALAPQIVFTKRHTIRPSFFAYTEGQSDAQHERHFLPDSALCLLDCRAPSRPWAEPVVTRNSFGQVRTLLADANGVIRDPAVSWDGRRVVFAWKKSLDEDDYHLYELTVDSGEIRQITSGLGFADYEPAYLPNGDLVFASTRCVQTVDCWWTEVSNLYTCDPEGRYLRRLSFDQVHAIFPQVLDDGRVIYTRWDYSDRGQIFPQALFQMNPDGTGQTEFYGNNSWFPTTIGHARGIPGTGKVLAILMGHHTSQAGKLGILDPAKGRQENTGAQLIAPVRRTVAERIDAYGQEGELFQYPYPLTATEFLVGFAPRGWNSTRRRQDDADFGIYWMDVDGRRELLVTDAVLPCQHPVPLAARTPPPPRAGIVDYRKTTGTYYMQDVYAGAALAGVPRGIVKKLRVVALEFRAAGVGNNGSSGPGGAALISTPIAIGNGSWDVKVVLGDATVHADGSAYFTVPARTPLYFQALDANHHAVQTMRSWSTLQPGETQSCVGCHESKNQAAPMAREGDVLALKAGPQTLEPFYGPPRGFSFPKEIQPILNRHCVRCHDNRSRKMEAKRLEKPLTRESDPIWQVKVPTEVALLQNTAKPASNKPEALPKASSTNCPAFSLLGTTQLDQKAKRLWSDAYLNLTLAYPSDDYESASAYCGNIDGRMVNWIGSQSVPTLLPPYAAGACRSELFSLLGSGHYGVSLSVEELDKLACWIDLYVPYAGDYFEANAWNGEELTKYNRYLTKRKQMEGVEQRNIEALVNQPGPE